MEILWFYLLLQRLLNQGRDDFFPLSVDYEEKMYSVGKIPGGFIKREGRPTKCNSTSRVIDRQIRPRFPNDSEMMLR